MIHSKPNVPFSWEKKPGVSKVISPPPCPVPEKSKVRSFQNLQIPLPPCAFNAPPLLRNLSKRIFKKKDDPFYMAQIECTKSSRKCNNYLVTLFKKDGFEIEMKKKKNSTSKFIFSCNKLFSVME